MSGDVPAKPVMSTGKPEPVEEFIDFCEAEFERRRNADGAFDEAAYRSAMQLVVDRMGAPGNGGGTR